MDASSVDDGKGNHHEDIQHVHQQQKPGDWEPRQSALMKHDTEIKQNFTIATGYG